jgi:hypothetical protein
VEGCRTGNDRELNSVMSDGYSLLFCHEMARAVRLNYFGGWGKVVYMHQNKICYNNC